MNTFDQFKEFSQKNNLPTTEDEWNTLVVVLYTYIKYTIYKLNIHCWQGNEHLFAEDIVSETIKRLLSYVKEVETGLHPPIKSPEAFCKVTATHFLLDQRRKDKRLIASLDAMIESNVQLELYADSDETETVIEDVSQYEILLDMARIIKSFSPKLQNSILIHIARLADFDDESPRPLEVAMAAVGIRLRDYDRALPRDAVLRSRHNALVCLAIKRLRIALKTPPSEFDDNVA